MTEMPFNFDKTFLKLIKEAKDPLCSYVQGGQCANFEEYMRITGRIAGLQQAENFLKELVSAYENR